MNKDCFDYEGWVNTIDITDVQSVYAAILFMINKEDFAMEQKLHGIGYVLDKNKEQYLNQLKLKNGNAMSKLKVLEERNLVLKGEAMYLRAANEKLRKQVKNCNTNKRDFKPKVKTTQVQQPNKKKIVVVRKKQNED